MTNAAEKNVSSDFHPNTRQVGLLRLYLGLNQFLIADIVIQVFLAGAGIFASGEFLVWHEYHSWALDVVTLLLLVISLLGRLPRSLHRLTTLLFVLVFMQAALIHASSDFHVPLLSAFHPVFALFIFVLPLYLHTQVQRLLKAETRTA